MTVPADSLDGLRSAIGRLLAADRRQRRRDQQSQDGSLTHAQVRSLLLLVREQEVTPGALARAADLNPASITAMVDQLEQHGLVVRRLDTRDRRRCWISLTDTGRKQLEAKEHEWRVRLGAALADVTPEQVAGATLVMERIAAAMEHRDLTARAAEAQPTPGPEPAVVRS